MSDFDVQIQKSQSEVQEAQAKISELTSRIEIARQKMAEGTDVAVDIENASLDDVHAHTEVMNANIAELIMGLDDVTAGFQQDFDEMRSKTGWESFVGIFAKGKSDCVAKLDGTYLPRDAAEKQRKRKLDEERRAKKKAEREAEKAAAKAAAAEEKAGAEPGAGDGEAAPMLRARGGRGNEGIDVPIQSPSPTLPCRSHAARGRHGVRVAPPPDGAAAGRRRWACSTS